MDIIDAPGQLTGGRCIIKLFSLMEITAGFKQILLNLLILSVKHPEFIHSLGRTGVSCGLVAVPRLQIIIGGGVPLSQQIVSLFDIYSSKPGCSVKSNLLISLDIVSLKIIFKFPGKSFD